MIVGSDADREGFVSQLFETRRVLEVPVFAWLRVAQTISKERRLPNLQRCFNPSYRLLTFAVWIVSFTPLSRSHVVILF